MPRVQWSRSLKWSQTHQRQWTTTHSHSAAQCHSVNDERRHNNNDNNNVVYSLLDNFYNNDNNTTTTTITLTATQRTTNCIEQKSNTFERSNRSNFETGPAPCTEVELRVSSPPAPPTTQLTERSSLLSHCCHRSYPTCNHHRSASIAASRNTVDLLARFVRTAWSVSEVHPCGTSSELRRSLCG